MDNTIREIVFDVAQKTGKTPEEVEEIYMSVFRFIKDKVEVIEFMNINTEEEFRKAKTNFNIPRILKLYTTPQRVEYVKAKIREGNSKHVQGPGINNDPEE
jgi:hypothetical protein